MFSSDENTIDENICDEDKPSDTDLMPPPPLPPVKDEIETNNNVVVEVKKEPIEVPSRPLANMLPSKYKDMDVTKLFPEFRHGQVSIELS